VPLVPPCNYSFPVASTNDFFQLAELIGSVGISATIGLSQRLALSDPLVARLISSILTVESRHDAFFRDVQNRQPNPAPFDTGISAIWAYNIALSFIVPGSCPVEIPIPKLPILTVADAPVVPYANNTNGTVVKAPAAPYANNTNTNGISGITLKELTWDPTQVPFVVEGDKQLLAGWVNQVDKPMYTPITIITSGKGTARMPQGMNGIAFVAVTTKQFENIDDLALGTLAGPAVVVVS
jgi:Ferritin-like domain